MELKHIAQSFDIKGNITDIQKITMGHINETHKICCDAGTDYILQKINTNVFKDPYALTDNIIAVTEHLGNAVQSRGGNREREAMTLVPLKDGGYLFEDGGAFYRMYICISNATCYNSAEIKGLLKNSAKAFGRFQTLLADFPAEKLHETIPMFHNTPKRMRDLEKSVAANASGRLSECMSEVGFFYARRDFCGSIVSKLACGELPLRVTHNDTKLNNVMMDNDTHEGICVIDLDTVMPGSVLYDFGDSIRFGASTAAEDEKDLSKVSMSLDLFEEYVDGFMSEAGNSLTDLEVEMLPIGAIMMTLECGMRFLADHIDGDKYFSLHYEGQNLDRARTQIKLVGDMEHKLGAMQAIVKKYRG